MNYFSNKYSLFLYLSLPLLQLAPVPRLQVLLQLLLKDLHRLLGGLIWIPVAYPVDCPLRRRDVVLDPADVDRLQL